MHGDFLYLGESFGDMQYLLVLKDDASHYSELVKCVNRFKIPCDWISDQGSNFKNEVINEPCARLKCQQIFSPTYSPWINGSVEIVNQDILQVLCVLTLDYKINYRDYLRLIPIVQASLNHTAAKRRASCSLVWTPSPLQAVFLLPQVTPSVQSARTSAEIESSCAGLRASVQAMHKAVKDARLKQTLLNKKRERDDNMVNFKVGDYVLRSRVDEKRQTKLLVTWVGPYVVTAAHALNVFTVKQLVTGEELDVHASWLKSSSTRTSKIGSAPVDDESRSYEILVGWHGLKAIEDLWKPLAAMYNDVNTLVKGYVAIANDSKLDRHLKALEASTKRR
ncbi:hypothetical protein PHMEG_00034786 [Phytophthora megakarya]|uniref:Integrase catalytic domain-containing protein n=1 Tax=Phytophthora megakarya TaxID=4795 RepID=A0A225URQ5_9STRA|nr:hypothetical protein PHMEG_00034786 [Phytophthora megakarya]